MQIAGHKSMDEEEREMADFLSSLDDNRIRMDKGGLRESDSSGVGGDLFFGPRLSSVSKMNPPPVGSRNKALKEGAYRGALHGRDMTPDWLEDFQALDVRDFRVKRKPAEKFVDNNGLTAHGEVPGAEPEILDGEFFPNNNDATKAGRSPSGEEHTSDHSRTAAAGSRRGWPFSASASGNTRRNSEAMHGDESTATSLSKHSEREDQQRLDWPETMDMLGLVESDGHPQKSRATSNLAMKEFPTMPPPPPREQSFPDFIEVRDLRSVSQWPKPSSSAGTGGGDSGDAANEGISKFGQGKLGGARHQAPLPSPLRTVEVYLRPDVTWESVSDVYMAVMLSRGLLVREQTEKMVTAEKATDNSGDWATVTLRVGVTRDKLRTLVIQFYADTRAFRVFSAYKKRTDPCIDPSRLMMYQAPILSLAGKMARFSGKAGDDLYSAIRDALVERRMPLSFLATDAREVSLDPHYVRDLVAMYAHENVMNLTRYALPLEDFVRGEEERTARLEATLLPKYRASGLVPPRPTRSKPLSAYPLTTHRPPVSSCGVEEAREIVERAREHATNIFEDADNTKRREAEGEREGAAAMAAAEGIRGLIRATWEDVKEWCDEEARARVRRKDSQVRDRLLAVERHREALVASLQDGAGGPTALVTPAGREFAARFRLMAEEAVLCECKAVHGKRMGQLYLTCNHICFHSSMLGFTSQKVLPLVTVASVSRSLASLPVAVDSVTVTDHGGESHSFGISAVEAGFPERFYDLLQQVFVMCKAEASRRAAKQAADGASDASFGEPDEEQILARVQRLAKVKMLREAREQAAVASNEPDDLDVHTGDPVPAPPAAESDQRPPPPPYTPWEKSPPTKGEADGRNASVSPSEDALEGGSEVTETAGGSNDSSAVAASATPTGKRNTDVRGKGPGLQASKMAMGIQAFLEESQRKS